MLGWWITLSTQSPNERDASPRDKARAAILAQWEVGVGGLDWIRQMVETGQAHQLKTGGYPSRYTAHLADVCVALGDGAVIKPKRGGQFDWHADRIAVCSPDQTLTIDAWDQS